MNCLGRFGATCRAEELKQKPPPVRERLSNSSCSEGACVTGAAIGDEADASEAKYHHCPGRRFGDSRRDFDRGHVRRREESKRAIVEPEEASAVRTAEVVGRQKIFRQRARDVIGQLDRNILRKDNSVQANCTVRQSNG